MSGLAEDYAGASSEELVRVAAILLPDASEYDELPVRHNEEQLNAELARLVRWEVDSFSLDNPHTKVRRRGRGGFCACPNVHVMYIVCECHVRLNY